MQTLIPFVSVLSLNALSTSRFTGISFVLNYFSTLNDYLSNLNIYIIIKTKEKKIIKMKILNVGDPVNRYHEIY